MPALLRGLAGRLFRAAGRNRDINWALLDQGTTSGVNFLTMVVLARQLGVAGFGDFVLAWLVLLFFKNLQNGLILSPMMSIGPKQDDDARPGYYGALTLQQGAMALGGFILVLIGYWVVVEIRPDWYLPGLALPLAAATAADQLQEFARRYCFCREQAARAFLVDAVAYGGRLVLLVLVLNDEAATGPNAFWVICAASMLGAAAAVPGITRLAFSLGDVVSVARRHWDFAKWTTASSVLEWGSGHLIVIVSGVVIGPAAVAAIRATTNLFAVIQVLTLALGNVMPVRAAQVFLSGGEVPMMAYLARMTVAGLLASGAVMLLGTVFAEELLLLLYGPDYVEYAYLMNWWVMIYAFGFLHLPLGLALKTIEFTSPFFLSVATEATFGVLASYFLPLWFGMPGVMFGILVTRALPVFVLGWFLFRRVGFGRGIFAVVRH